MIVARSEERFAPPHLLGRRTIVPVVLSAMILAPAMVSGAQTKSPMDSISKLPGNWVERDSSSMLAPARLASLSPPEATPWIAYIARSREWKARDQSLIRSELGRVGRDTMTRAPYVHDFGIRPYMTGAWFASDSARRIADQILTWQTPSGGWSKHVDVMLRARQPGESFFSENSDWQYIATIDNESTTSEMQFLASVEDAMKGGEPRYRAAFLRGVRYLLDAQYPNGCWPQVYPLQGGYHDAATFNDDASLHVLELLGDVGAGAGPGAGKYGFVGETLRAAARAAVTRGVSCILASQVVVNGRKTVWGQQHDPLTLAPVQARSYELASISAQESAHLLDYLMRIESPNLRVLAAVHDGVAWLKETPVAGLTWDFKTGLHEVSGAGPLWARMYEIGTNRPIFSDRDGVKRYTWSELNDRRLGYAWYTDAPIATLRTYEAWSRKHPRSTAH